MLPATVRNATSLSLFVLAVGMSAVALTIDGSNQEALLFGGNVSQLAAVIETTAKGCPAAIELAKKGQTSGTQSAGSEEIGDKCIAARFDPSKVKRGEQNPKQKSKNYTCVGKLTVVSLSEGRTIERWTAASIGKEPKAGTCKCVKGCEAKKRGMPQSSQPSGGLNGIPQLPPISGMPQEGGGNGVQQTPYEAAQNELGKRMSGYSIEDAIRTNNEAADQAYNLDRFLDKLADVSSPNIEDRRPPETFEDMWSENIERLGLLKEPSIRVTDDPYVDRRDMIFAPQTFSHAGGQTASSNSRPLWRRVFDYIFGR